MEKIACTKCAGTGKVDWIIYAKGEDKDFSKLHADFFKGLKGIDCENETLMDNVIRHMDDTEDTDVECFNCSGNGFLLKVTTEEYAVIKEMGILKETNNDMVN